MNKRRWYVSVLLGLCLCLFTAFGAACSDFFGNGLVYSVKNNEYSVTGYKGTDTDVVIPRTYRGYPVTSIGDRAFYFCESLTSIEIPDSVTSIGDYAFNGCRSLTSILVGENNTAYQSIDGNLYSKDGKTLIQYAIGKTTQSFTIPDGVTSIGKNAFYDCRSLTSIEIPDSVTSIGDSAFRGCVSLTSVTFENTSGWTAGETSLSSADLENYSTAAEYLTFSYCYIDWKRS